MICHKVYELLMSILNIYTKYVYIYGKTLKKIDRLAKYIYYIEISLNTSFFKESIPKQQRKKTCSLRICSEKYATKEK